MNCMIGLAVLAAVALAGCTGGSRSEVVNIGSEGILDFSFVEAESCPVFVTVEALSRFVDAVAIKDRYGYREALAAAYLVPKGTRVQVIGGSGLGKRRVRILEGRYAGTAGYVLTEWVRSR